MATAETTNTIKVPAKDKAASFKKVVEPRVGKALAAIAVIGNCANKGNYEYTVDQVIKIKEALEAEVKVLMSRFENPTATQSAGFSL